LTDLDRCFAIAIDGVSAARLAPLLSIVTVSGTPLKLVALGAQQKSDAVAVTVDRAVEIPPFALDPE